MLVFSTVELEKFLGHVTFAIWVSFLLQLNLFRGVLEGKRVGAVFRVKDLQSHYFGLMLLFRLQIISLSLIDLTMFILGLCNAHCQGTSISSTMIFPYCTVAKRNLLMYKYQMFCRFMHAKKSTTSINIDKLLTLALIQFLTVTFIEILLPCSFTCCLSLSIPMLSIGNKAWNGEWNKVKKSFLIQRGLQNRGNE